MAVEMNAKVIGKMEFAPGNFVLKVAPDGWELKDFTAGQFCVLGLPGSAPRHSFCDKEEIPVEPDKLIRRAYSIASSSDTKEYLEFYISVVRSGALTPRLYNLNVGDSIWLGKKSTGMFTLDRVPDGTNVVLIATGTGLAPYMSMMRTLITKGGIHSKFAVIHGANHSLDLGYRSELETLERLQNNFAYIPVVSMPEQELVAWNGPIGFVEDAWKGKWFEDKWGFRPNSENTHVFLCGNPLMIDSALKFLGDENFVKHTKTEDGNIHLEEFW